jgi:hypothetical protein
MELLVLSTILISVGIFFVPLYLMGGRPFLRRQDFAVSSQATPPEVIRNSSAAYALRLIIFGLFFGWGASGDFWPALISAACYSMGWGLVFLLRRPIIEFMDGALRNDRSITVHEFITRQHGNDPRVRLLSSGLTIFALFAVVLAEAMAVSAFLQPLHLAGTSSVTVAAGVLLAMALYATLSGNSAVMQSVQWQFGLAYLGLFGTAALLLYIHVSGLTPLPPHGVFAILISACCCGFILYYRRSKYVDTNPVRPGDEPRNGNSSDPLTVRLLRRLGKVLNPSISVCASLTIVLAGMGFLFAGLPEIARSAGAALQTGIHVTNAGWIALIIVPLFYPIADVTNWQRIAAAVKSDASNTDLEASPDAWRRLFRACAVETPLLWLLMWALGALAAAAATEPSIGSGSLQALVEQLAAEQNDATAVALPLLLLCAFAMALSAMAALLSAAVCTMRYDILQGDREKPGIPAPARQRWVLGSSLVLALLLALSIFDAWSSSFTSNALLGLTVAICCAQLSFVPLVLGPLVIRSQAGSAAVSAPWALAVLCAGAGSAVSGASMHLVTGSEAWLWLAAPASLGSSLIVFSLGRICARAS